ncbi:MAG: LamG domain-containing protein [Bacteroidetes bacterium]|nr:LamG domain-containing protein [Bacteroidota bacterium]
MNGTNGSTTFTDNAGGSSHTFTPVGNTQISTAQHKFGTASGFFDGSGDYLTTPDCDDWSFGDGDWTIDTWVYLTEQPGSATGNYYNIVSQSQAAGQDGNNFFYAAYRWGGPTETFLECVLKTGGTTHFVAQTVMNEISLNTWHHFAWVRYGTTVKAYLDGTLVETSGTIVGTPANLTGVLNVGTWPTYTTHFFTGWMDELRISKGIARWTANFTPPTSEYLIEAPTVSAINPNNSVNTGSVFISSVTGSNFQSGATVSLTKSGQSDINCTGFNFANSSTLSNGTCPITGAAVGNWNIIVTNPDNQFGTLTNGFAINNPLYFSNACTGGSITHIGGNTIHTFTSNGTLVCTETGTVNVLIVGGGGAGGGNTGAGGGAGGFISTSTSVSGNITVTVGNGGTGVINTISDGTPGGNGGNSVFGTITAFGGGGGGSYSGSTTNGEGQNGGAGGGGGTAESTFTNAGGIGSQGYNGGTGFANTSNNYASGGGGGAGSAGTNASPGTGGNGGVGRTSSISGSSVTYAGGGGGSAYTTFGTGGTGGGGNGTHAPNVSAGSAGTANTGGGGGGGKGSTSDNSYSGGSGIVIVSYLFPVPTPATVNWNNSNVQEITLTTTRSFTFTNGKSGGIYTLMINQDNTGGWAVSWPANVKWAGGTAPIFTTTANSIDLLKFVYNGTYYLGYAPALDFK